MQWIDIPSTLRTSTIVSVQYFPTFCYVLRYVDTFNSNGFAEITYELQAECSCRPGDLKCVRYTCPPEQETIIAICKDCEHFIFRVDAGIMKKAVYS
jgi:hypothetical protein